MAAVAVATPLRQDAEGCERGRCVCEGQGSCVPSSLVWVSVPPSGSASSNAPGSLNGLSLREGREERERERRQRAVHSATGTKKRRTLAQMEMRAAHHSLRTFYATARRIMSRV